MLHRRYAAIDQSTTATLFAVLDEQGQLQIPLILPHRQITPRNGWVEHDALEILHNIRQCLSSSPTVDALGLCHQGESVVAWDARSKRPVYNAIIWQDMRTLSHIQALHAEGVEPLVQARSGLPLDPYFSASKMHWILANVPEAQRLLNKGQLRIGTMDSFFLDHLCGVYCTDYNSASRTSLFNLHTQQWDPDLCKLFGVPIECLPEIRDTLGVFGHTEIHGSSIPVTASLVDQFAGSYGHGCRGSGDTKITFGTGAFLQTLTGHHIAEPNHSGLLPVLCWKFPHEPAVYGLDGGVYNAASAINWLQKIGLLTHLDELNHFDSPSALSRGLAFVPALSGLGCPYWDRTAAGVWAGLSLEMERTDLLQSVLEGIALRAVEVVQAMETLNPLGDHISIDGGLSANPYFRQFLANTLQKTVVTPANTEVTALGVALLARKGLGVENILPTQLPDCLTPPNQAPMPNSLEHYQRIVARSRGLRDG